MRKAIARDQNQRKRAVSSQVSSWVNFTPASLGNIALWLDASDTSTITESGGAVSQWNDKSPNARHFTQATGSLQPTYGTVTQNGLNVVVFDGTNDRMDFDAGSDAIDLSPLTAFFVVYDNNGSQGSTELFRRAFSARRSVTGAADFQAPNFGIGKINTSRSLQTYLNGVVTSGVSYDNQTWLLATVNGSTTGGSIQVNNGSPATSASNCAVGDMRYMRVGAISWSTGNPPDATYAGNSFSWWQGYFAEIILFNENLTTNQVLLVKQYLRNKWNLIF